MTRSWAATGTGPPAAIAGLLLAAAILALILNSVFWWPALMGAVAMARGPVGSGRLTFPTIARFWLVAVVVGSAVEAAHIAGSLWVYIPPADRAWATILVVLAGYPLMFAATVRLHASLRRRAGAAMAVLLTLSGMVLLNEVPNSFVPIWQRPGGADGLLATGLAAGYLAVVMTAIAAWAVLTGTDRSGPQDTILWRMIRAAVLAVLLDAMRQVLEARELHRASGPTRLLRPEVDAIAERLEAAAAQLRPVARLDRLPGIGNRLMVELAVFTSAAYRVLLDAGWTPDQARAAVADAGWIVYARMLKLAALPAHLTRRDPGARLRHTIRSLLRFPFHAPGAPGYAVETRTESGNIHTNFTHCPPQSFVRALIEQQDRGDLDAFRDSWCRYDWPGADLIAADGQRSHYTRRRTLSHGDPVCDMCWMAKAAPVGDPNAATEFDRNQEPEGDTHDRHKARFPSR